jgi:CheY-like chemotaxis protein
MKDIAENRVDVYHCPACAAMNAAADSDWCLCTGKERTLVCSKCGRCFCDAPAAWKRDFWRDTSAALAQRRKGNMDEVPGLQFVETHPVRPVILLIDDDKVVHVVVPRVLAGFHGTLLHAYDGEEGLRMAQTVKPDLVITDVLLPKIDGRQICHLLKSSPDTCRTKVVVMTGVFRGAHYRREAIREFAVDEFLEKPITAGKLRLVVETMLRMQIPVVSQRPERHLVATL